jgi:hypothetical protein
MSINNVCKKVLFRAYDRFINCNTVLLVNVSRVGLSISWSNLAFEIQRFQLLEDFSGLYLHLQ